MTTKKQLPVWRMNTGDGVPSDLGNFIVLGDFIYDTEWLDGVLSCHREDEWRWGVTMISNRNSRIYAYQTTRTKAAKYRG